VLIGTSYSAWNPFESHNSRVMIDARLIA